LLLKYVLISKPLLMSEPLLLKYVLLGKPLLLPSRRQPEYSLLQHRVSYDVTR
jgi:hypothetical protein